MPSVQPCELPAAALLRRYQGGGGFADCYVAFVPRTVSQAEFVEAFYTSAVFRLERVVLRLAGRPSTDAQARALALGQRDTFAAWAVEGRDTDQLLLADDTGRTRSWLMTVAAADGAGRPGTRLYFGSAVVPRPRRHGEHPGGDGDRDAPALGGLFRALLGFHRLYSRTLLRAACARVSR